MAASDAAAPGDAAGFRTGVDFWKMSGSGNDFVAFDRTAGSQGTVAALPDPATVRALCRRGLGVGADGVMVLRRAPDVDYELVYFNADGTRAELCGNASLCSIRLAVELGIAPPAELAFATDAGRMRGRIVDGLPEMDMAPPTELTADRSDLVGTEPAPGDRLGFARVGVPHVVIRCADAARVDLDREAPRFRQHPALRDGANVNFASATADAVALRTFERGVEAETLACGTGSVATALLMADWDGRARPGSTTVLEIVTRSGLRHRVRATWGADGRPSAVALAGAARIVFRATLGEGDWG